MYGDYVQELIEHGHNWFSLIKQISQQWAVCDDWGDKGLLTLMDIPEGSNVPAMWGRAKAQPKIFNPNIRETTRSYEGGALQLIIPVCDTDWRLNPQIASMIKRKMMTAQLLRDPDFKLENSWVSAKRKEGRNI